MRTPRARIFTLIVSLLAFAALALAQTTAWAQSRSHGQAELDSLLAPIALYPDPLLSQILMAATYPTEVIEAAGWARDNPGLQGDAAVQSVQEQDWDPSVKSLVAFPNLLQRMDENLDWMRGLGAAFLAQEPQVMDTIQQLRARARAAGNLAPDARTRVVEIDRAIAIEAADPQVVYLPYYDPGVVYGRWWWPAHPPVAWAPWPGYQVRLHRPGVAVGWYWGPAIRVSLDFFFGAPDWQRRYVRVAAVRNYYYHPRLPGRAAMFNRPQAVRGVHPDRWQHVPARRHGADYRRIEVQRRFAPVREAREIHTQKEARREIAAPPRRRDAPAPVFRAPRPVPRVETPRLLAVPGLPQAHPRRGTDRRIAAPHGVERPRLFVPRPRPAASQPAAPAAQRAPGATTRNARSARHAERTRAAVVPQARTGIHAPGARPARVAAERARRSEQAGSFGATRGESRRPARTAVTRPYLSSGSARIRK